MLEIENLSVSFSNYTRGMKRESVCTIRCLDLHVEAGQIIAIVGQSGAGKSLLAHAVLDILPGNSSVSGNMYFKNTKITHRTAKKFRGKGISLIPQSVSFLNPLLHVGTQIARSGVLSGMNHHQARMSSEEILEKYGLSAEIYDWFPFQLSGGMARRVLTATATIGTADLLIADEPTNGLDENVAHETLMHLRQLADTGKAVVLITHDIESALQVADRVSVFYGGVTLEEADAADFYNEGSLRHPYSRQLWSSLPCNQFTEAVTRDEISINNEGCPFYMQCPNAIEKCSHELPELSPYHNGKVRCWRA
jgi:peptide/nickel transport system ATP-binding protein